MVDDNKDVLDQVVHYFATHERPPLGGFEVLTEERFDRFAARLDTERIDLVILDVRKDSEPLDEVAGLTAHEGVAPLHFVPTVFYTAHAEKVEHLRSSAVAVVSKDDSIPGLAKAVDTILESGLLKLRVYLEDSFRRLVTEATRQHIGGQAGPSATIGANLARALARELDSPALRELLKLDPDRLHPNEYYCMGRAADHPMTGDILRHDGMVVVIVNPSCDLVSRVIKGKRRHPKVDSILVAVCQPLEASEVVSALRGADLKLKEARDKCDAAGERERNTKLSSNAGAEAGIGAAREHTELKSARRSAQEKVESCRENLTALMRNREPALHFLPGIGDHFPDLVADFHDLRLIPFGVMVDSGEHLASMNPPFRELLNGRFAQFMGRVGVPELDMLPIWSRLGISGAG